jgi:hypothetical protein
LVRNGGARQRTGGDRGRDRWGPGDVEEVEGLCGIARGFERADEMVDGMRETLDRGFWNLQDLADVPGLKVEDDSAKTATKKK